MAAQILEVLDRSEVKVGMMIWFSGGWRTITAIEPRKGINPWVKVIGETGLLFEYDRRAPRKAWAVSVKQ